MSLLLLPRAAQNHRTSPSDPYFSSVVALLHCDGTNGSTTITDVIGKIWSVQGALTSISTAQIKYGTASLYVGNTSGSVPNNGIYTASSTDFNFGTADFTIEFWLYLTSLVNNQTSFDRGYITAGGLLMQTGAGTGEFITYVGGSSVMTESSAATTSVWQHHALVKDSGTLRKYRGGVQTSSVANSVNITNTSTAAFGGASSAAASGAGTYPIVGYIDDIRITKGVCRYPNGTTFTPPTAAFPDH